MRLTSFEHPHRQVLAARPPGFTLVEMMAVMAVIAILLSVAAVGIQRIDRGQALTTAISISEASLEEARSAAIGRNTRARLLVHGELNDDDAQARERYLRYLTVAVYEVDLSNPGEDNGTWRVITRGTALPGSVYYSPMQSDDASKNVEGMGTYGEMTIKLPGQGTTQTKCFYYEFNSEGVCVDGDLEGADPGAAFVLVSGSRPRNQEEATIRRNNKSGFVIWRNGSTALYRNADQMGQ